MPRNGSDIFYILPGTEGFPDTTIESEKYNNYIHDVETDLNRPRPIIAGGTGANNAKSARTALGAEVAVQYVTNYDSHVWENGSFWSNTPATGGPVSGHMFGGTAIVPDNNPDYTILIARDQSDGLNPGRTYVREKTAGVWGAWSQDNTGVMSATAPVNPPDGLLWWNSTDGQLYVYYRDVDTAQWVIASPVPDPAQFLLKAGDTMQGTLGLAAPPVAALDAANKSYVDGHSVAKAGDVMTGQLAAPSFFTNATPTTGVLYFGDGTHYLQFNGTSFILSNGLNSLGNIAGDTITARGVFSVSLAAAPTQGTIHFGNSGASYLRYNGSSYSLNGGPLFAGSITSSNVITTGEAYASSSSNVILSGTGGNVYLRPHGAYNSTNDVQLNAAGQIRLSGDGACFAPPNGVNGGFVCKDGSTNAFTGSYFNIGFDGSAGTLSIDNTSFGPIYTTSDYRIKKDVAPISGTWENVKALNPVKYTHKDFTPPSEAENKERKGPLFRGDDIERWGFIAHELQETLIESAATGKKDAPDAIQSVDAMTVIAALTKALQEAMERIEALEAKV